MHSLGHEDKSLLYAAGELSPAEAAAFEGESASCAPCREFLAASRAASRVARDAGTAPPAGLDERVMALAVQAGTAPATSPPASRACLTLVLAAALFAATRAARQPLPAAQDVGAAPRGIAGLERDLSRVSEELDVLSRSVARWPAPEAAAGTVDEDIESDILDLESALDQLDGRMM